MKLWIKLIAYSGLMLLSSALHAQSAIYFVHSDHLGTPQVLTDKDQNVVWRAEEQLPFGEVTESGSVKQPIRFPGQYADAETGFYYNYYRDYDPSLGRYLQSDPIGLRGGLNTYTYVSGNPVNYVDPYGLEAITVTAIAVATYRALSVAGKLGAFGGPKSLSGVSIPGVVITPDGRVLLPPYNNENASEDGGQCEVPASEKEAKQMGRRIGKEIDAEAKRNFHDMKEKGEPDRSKRQLIQDAQDVFRDRGLPIPRWLL